MAGEGGGWGGGGGFQPGAQSGVGEVGGGKVVCVHLGAEGVDFGVDEEGGVRGAGVGPDNVWGRGVVPGGYFLDYADVFCGAGEVCADCEEALFGWVFGVGL